VPFAIGLTWHPVSSPNPSRSGNAFASTSGSSPNDAWAVGSYDNGAGVNKTLALHWNGFEWVQK
jgi:hypothetical protein